MLIRLRTCLCELVLPEVEVEEVGAEAEVPLLHLHHVGPGHGELGQRTHHPATPHHLLASC